MNPVELGRGRSFKGLAAYLLHDASEEEGEKLTSSERVGWTQSFNLNEAQPDKAWRLMASTAMSAPALKAASGLPKGGGVNKKPVYHYTLTWPESDSGKLSPQLQQKAVAESLAALKLEQHQALAIEHTDGDHKHIHVMVNLINPEDGTTPKLSYTKKNLRKWANKFEQTHGLKVTEGSRINEQKRQNGEEVNARRKPRNVYEQEKREGDNPRLKWLRNQEAQIAKTLQLENKQMKAQHNTQWAALKQGYHAHRDALKAAQETAVQSAIDETKAAYKPKWAALFKANREALQNFDAGERSAVAKVFNMGRTYFAARKEGNNMPDSLLAASMKTERRLFVEKGNQQKQKALASELKQDISAKVGEAKKQHSAQIFEARAEYLNECKALSHNQKAERAEQQQNWREYSERREDNFQQIASQNQDLSNQQGYGFGQSFNNDR